MTMVDPATAAPGPQDRPRPQRLAALLLSAQAGRREALEQIVVELSPLLWHVVRAQGLDRDTAQDVVQHTWLKLLDGLDRIHSPLGLTRWLVTTAKHEAWRVSAARQAQPLADLDLMTQIPDPRPTPEDDVLLDEQHRQVWRAVLSLSPRCRDLLRVIAFVPRPDYEAVAAALDMPRGSIGPTRSRCLAKLRAELDDDAQGSSV